MIPATSWLVGTLVGLGIFPALLLVRKTAWLRMVAGVNLAHTLTLLLMLGLLADLLVGLLFGSLRIQQRAGWAGLTGLGVLLLAGVALIARGSPQSPWVSEALARTQWPGVKLLGYACAFIGLVAVSLAIAALPLIDWDARSIWFFHGKAVFFDGGLHPSDFWRNTEYDWSHKAYPPLIPLLAARAADFTLGSWNEFAPKLGLVPLACAGFLGLLVVTQSSLELGLLVFSTIAVLGSQLWNGYADGWLALEGCIAVYALARWAESGDRDHLLFGCAALAIALCLKNEGQLLFAVAIPLFLYGAYRQWQRLQVQDALIGLVFSPFALWLLRKPQLASGGDLEGGDLLARAFRVVINWPEMTHRLVVLAQTASKSSFLFESLAAFLLFGRLMGFDRVSALLGGAALLYTLGMIMVYFGTPWDFAWHVRFSLDRVLMLPTLLLLAGVCRMIQASAKTQLERA